jgi:hypothetical protein
MKALGAQKIAADKASGQQASATVAQSANAAWKTAASWF